MGFGSDVGVNKLSNRSTINYSFNLSNDLYTLGYSPPDILLLIQFIKLLTRANTV